MSAASCRPCNSEMPDSNGEAGAQPRSVARTADVRSFSWLARRARRTCYLSGSQLPMYRTSDGAGCIPAARRRGGLLVTVGASWQSRSRARSTRLCRESRPPASAAPSPFLESLGQQARRPVQLSRHRPIDAGSGNEVQRRNEPGALRAKSGNRSSSKMPAGCGGHLVIAGIALRSLAEGCPGCEGIGECVVHVTVANLVGSNGHHHVT